jgi:MFS family permease
MVAGLTGVAIVMALMGLLGRDTNLWFMRLLMFLTGAGMAYAFVPGQTATFATISSAATGQASALSNALRQLGSALGVAVLGEVLSFVGPTRLSASGMVEPNLTAYHAAFLAAAVLALVAAGIALGIDDRDAVATMRPRVRQPAREATSEHGLGVEAGSPSL